MHQHAPRTEAQRRLDESVTPSWRRARPGGGRAAESDPSRAARGAGAWRPVALAASALWTDATRPLRARRRARSRLGRRGRDPVVGAGDSSRLTTECARRRRALTDGRIAIIESSFAEDEELFAPEERQPVPARAAESLVADAPTLEQPAPDRAPVLYQPGPTAHPSGRPFRAHRAALSLAAAVIFVAALCVYGPRLQRQPEGQLESWGAVTATPPDAAPHSQPERPAIRSTATESVSRQAPAPVSRTARRAPFNAKHSSPIAGRAAPPM